MFFDLARLLPSVPSLTTDPTSTKNRSDGWVPIEKDSKSSESGVLEPGSLPISNLIWAGGFLLEVWSSSDKLISSLGLLRWAAGMLSSSITARAEHSLGSPSVRPTLLFFARVDFGYWVAHYPNLSPELSSIGLAESKIWEQESPNFSCSISSLDLKISSISLT